jgi:signal-transduction protein with cAMP-binding, CBS, and nucleotidyltransferase domain
MKVETILRSKGQRVVTVQRHASIESVIGHMRLEKIGAIVISPDGQTVDGIVSERDVVRALAAHGAEIVHLKAEDIMTHQVTTCSRQDSVQSVMATMTRNRIRHLPVVEKGRLEGIVSIGDAVKNRLEEIELEATVLRDAYLATH